MSIRTRLVRRIIGSAVAVVRTARTKRSWPTFPFDPNQIMQYLLLIYANESESASRFSDPEARSNYLAAFGS